MVPDIATDDESTEIINKDEIRVGTFEPDEEDMYVEKGRNDNWWMGSLRNGKHVEIECDISEYIAGAAGAGEYVDLSPFAEAMIFAHELAEETSLTHKQAEIWTVREKLGWSRGQVDTRFDMSSSNVDEHLRVARKKIDQAHRLVELVE